MSRKPLTNLFGFLTLGGCRDGASKTLNPGAPLQAIRYRKQLEVPEQSIELDRDGGLG